MSLSNLINKLSENKDVRTAKQIREIVPIEHWLESPFYVGPDGVGIYDVWKQHIANVCNGRFADICLTGSLGSGKSTIADYILIRKFYELSAYDMPAFLFGMLTSTIIVALYFSVTQKQAERTGYGKIRRIVDSVPYFQKYYPRNKDKDSILEFQHLHVMFGSQVSDQLGLDLAYSVLDESNFMGKDKTHIEEYDKATALYTAVSNRRLNRFVVGQEDMGLSILVSSAADPSSFVESRIREADELKAKGKDVIYVANVVSYETKRKQYSEEEFCVFIGTDTVDPMIIENEESLQRILLALGFELDTIDWRLSYIPIIKRHLPESLSMKFKFVPEEMRRLFDQNMRQAIQDVIGMSMESDLKLYKNRALYKEATNGVSNMFYKDTFILSMNDQIPISEYFKFDFKQPTTQHFIHVDQAVTRDANQKIQNRLGMACAHIERFEKVAGELLPYVHVDFLLSINPPEKPDEIPLWKIRQFIIWLRDSGLNIGKVTFDQFQSRDQMQILMQNNITSERYSVDMDDKDWLSLVKLFYERRIRLPYHKIFVEEFFKLEHNLKTHKINHSAGEFKDLSDALTGACANAILNTNVGAWNLSQFVDQGKKKNETGNIYEMIKNNKLPGMF